MSMKAMILAAGLGTRLLPFTAHTPKPLFTISGEPILGRTIQRLAQAGATAVMVNTHHLHHQIEAFLDATPHAVPVRHRFEPRILGTGGAIKNAADFWDDKPFLVVNGDLDFDFDLEEIYRFHCAGTHPVTMVLCDDPEFNQVWVDDQNRIFGFGGGPPLPLFQSCRPLTFTGIQVVSPSVLTRIPAGKFVSIIDVYRDMLAQGESIRAAIPQAGFWKDLGSLDRYSAHVYDEMAPRAFQRAFPGAREETIVRQKLKGDGSDRGWYRLVQGERTLVMADHGIRHGGSPGEAEAFVAIGNHLRQTGAPVPQIVSHDVFAGLVFLEDLGDANLQQTVLRSAGNHAAIASLYHAVIDRLLHMSCKGIEGFDPAWTVQSPSYDRQLILDKECRYFVDAFLNGYLNMGIDAGTLQDEFQALAGQTVAHGFNGLMHRDLQSRNILIKDGRPYFIDFQGARKGPLQYDLASLLIDPYVNLPRDMQQDLLAYCTERLHGVARFEPQAFETGYRCCAITRNLQALGAFGHLSRRKGKTYFEAYIPPALSCLSHNLLYFFETHQYPKLKQVVTDAHLVLSSLPPVHAVQDEFNPAE